MRREQRAGAASVPGGDVPRVSCALEPEKGTLSEQRVAPQQPLQLLCQCVSWERLSLQYVNAAVNAIPESFPEQMACDGAEDPQQDSHIWKGGAGLVELVEESCMVPTSRSCGKSDKLH